MSNTDPRILRSRASIENAFLVLLQTKDCDRISIQDILDLSGYSRTAFYSNFATKEGLICAILDQIASELSCCIGKTLFSSLAERELFDILHLFDFIYDKRVAFSRLLLVNQEYKSYCVSRIVEAVCSSDVYKNENRVLSIYIFFGMIISTVEWWQNSRYKYSPQYVGEVFSQFYFCYNSSLHNFLA